MQSFRVQSLSAEYRVLLQRFRVQSIRVQSFSAVLECRILVQIFDAEI